MSRGGCCKPKLVDLLSKALRIIEQDEDEHYIYENDERPPSQQSEDDEGQCPPSN